MRSRFRSITLAVLAAGSLALAACSAGSLGSSDDEGGGKVTLSFLVDNTDDTVADGRAARQGLHREEPGHHGQGRDPAAAARATTSSRPGCPPAT